MKIKAKNITSRLFEDICVGDVFYSETDPNDFLLRTDDNSWVAVGLETGVLYHINDFNHDDAQYHIVEAEVTIYN